MRRSGVTAAILMLVGSASAQKSKVTSTYYALQSGDLAEAKRDIDEAVANEATAADAKAWYYYAETYTRIFLKNLDTTIAASDRLAQNPHEQAWKGFQNAVLYDPELRFRKIDGQEFNWIGMHNGLIYVQAGFFTQGTDYLEDESQNEQSYQAFANAAEVQKMREVQLEAAPDTVLLYYQAITAERLGRNEEALKRYERLLSWKFDYLPFYQRLAELYVTLDRVDDALVALEVGETMYPKLIVNRLDIYFKTGQIEERLDEFEKATQLDPENSELLYALGTIYNTIMDTALAHGQTAKATEFREKSIATYTRVLGMAPRHHGANYNMGVLYFNDASAIEDEINALPREATKAEHERLVALKVEKLQAALPFLKAAYETASEEDLERSRRALRKTYVRLEMMEEANELK